MITTTTTQTPFPVPDISDVTIGKDLEELIDLLAETQHNKWANRKLADGWIYGTEFNEPRKTTPHLVPYSELSDSIKISLKSPIIKEIKTILHFDYWIAKDIPNF